MGVGAPPPCCTSYHPPSSGPAPTVALKVVGTRVLVDYEAPNYYCQNTGDWPPDITCVNDPLVSDHLEIFVNSQLFDTAFIYYEKGTWDTGIDIPCGGTGSFQARIAYVAEGPTQIISASTATTALTAVCPDRNPCPTCSIGGPNTEAGNPIHVGSGDVNTGVGLFSLSQSPLSLPFGLSYHSATPIYPGLVSSPIGLGWTHPYAQTLRPTDPSNTTLYHLTAEGFEHLFQLQPNGSWAASNPGVLRGTVTKDTATNRFLLTDLDGTVTAFDVPTGRWLSTTDRWGNVLTGGYDTNGLLTSITDAVGRQVIVTNNTSGQVTQVSLPDGQAWRFGYSGNLLTQVFDPFHTGTTAWRTFSYQPDQAGIQRLLSQVTDEQGFLIEGHTYDSADRGATSIAQGGRDSVTVEYNVPAQGQRRVTHAIDATTSQVSVFTLTYQQGQYLPTQVVGSCASCGGSSDTYNFTFDASNHVATMTDGNSHVTQFGYNADGNVTSRTEAKGTPRERTTTYDYGYAPWPNFRTKITEPSAAKPGQQKVTTMTWNATGSPETTLTVSESGYLLLADTSATTYTSTTTFDTRHRVVAVDGPRTDVVDVTTRSYFADTDPTTNRRGRLQQTTDAVGLTSTYDSYDVFGTPKLVTDPNGVQTGKVTDAKGRTTTSTAKAVPTDPNEPTDYTTTYTFDLRDRLTETTLPRGNKLRRRYEDGTNRLTDTLRVDLSGNEVERKHLTLNLIGDRIQEEDQGCTTPAPTCAAWVTKRTESFVYDTHNRLVEIDHPVPAGSKALAGFDADGLVATVQDENHTSPNTTNGYDELHRLTSVRQTLATAPAGQITTTYGYDVMDNLASLTDPNGNVTTYQFDDFRRMQTQTSPVSGLTTCSYDPAGNLLSSTDANGATTIRTYDAANRPLSATSSRASLPTESVTYTYDNPTVGAYGKGRLATMTDPSGATAYAYERRGMARSEVKTIERNTYTLGYSFDPNGNRKSLTYPSGRTVNYTFDFADRPFSASSGSTVFVSSATYLPFGPESTLTYGNGTVKSASYDLRYRPAENKLANASNATIADYTYQEDPIGNITQIHDAVDATYNRDFGYDDLSRLTSANTGTSLWGTGSYTYDAMGNMQTLTLGSYRTATYAYQGTLPKLAQVTENGTARSVSYDAAGNEAGIGAATYGTSSRNSLAAADGLAYTYNGGGVRTITTVASSPGTLTGTVVNAIGGAPIPAATVRTQTGNSTTTDGSGNFTLTLPAGAYTVTASKIGFVPNTTASLNVTAGGTVSAGAIPLSAAPGTVTGTVVSSAGGGPVAGATISTTPASVTTTTNAQGSFTLNPPAGTYTVTIAQAGYTTKTTGSITVTAGGTTPLGTITLQANNGAIAGTVVNSATNAVIAGATVTASGNALRPSGGIVPLSGPTSSSTTTDASGNFNLAMPPGTYTVTIAKVGFGAKTTPSLTVNPGATVAMGTISLDPLGTITGTVINAAGGAAIAGATVSVVGTLNSATTDASGHFTLSQTPGTYSLTASAPGFADFTTSTFTLAGGGSYNAGNLPLSAAALLVYVGYADDLRSSPVFPNPWKGSPNVVFIGSASPYDAGAIRLDNTTDNPMSVDSVAVDLSRPGPTYNLWGSFTIPSHGTVILTQTTPFNFDTSDSPIVGCGQALPPNDPRVPKLTITVGGLPTSYFDTGHILDTGGYDLACRSNESLQWRLVGTTGINSNGDFRLDPATGTSPLGQSYTLTATATDANNQPLPGATVTFKVTAGPNVGRTGTATTNAQGQATFSYASTIAGTDTLKATIPNPTGGTLNSNPVTVTWPSQPGLGVFVAYADSLRPNPNFPIPWQGAPNTIFIGCCPPYDGGAIRLDNTTDNPMLINSVSTDLQRPGPVFNLWGSFTIPAHQSAILTQTNTSYNFDTSDYPLVGCGGTLSPTETRIPKITVTVGGFASSYLDTAHILDTFGFDLACLQGGQQNESLAWRPVGGTGSAASANLALLPPTATNVLGASYTATAVATDAAHEPLANVVITFRVTSGPNAGKTGTATTGASGIATFTYTSATVGTDTLTASLTNATGGVLFSSNVTSTWVTTATLTLAPPSATNALGAPYNATLTVKDGNNQPLANLTVAFQITSGPNQGKTGTGTTNAQGQALFTYTSMTPGTDVLQASIGLSGGNSILSNTVSAGWNAPLAISLAPATASTPINANYTATATVTGSGGQPAPNQTVTFTVTAGPNQGKTGTSTTNAEGQALFTYTSTVTGTDTLQASVGSGNGAATSNTVTSTWTPAGANVAYTGPSGIEYGDPSVLSAKLTDTTTAAPLSGKTLSFAFGSQTLPGTTDATGSASVTLTPSTTGPATLTISFAGDAAHTSASATATVTVMADDTALTYTGSPVVANGTSQALAAKLIDPAEGVPLAGKTVTFTINGLSASGTTDAQGVATATLTIPPDIPEPAQLAVAFAGDATSLAAQVAVPVTVYKTTTITYTGPTTAEYSDPAALTARLSQTTNGTPLVGKTLTLNLAGQTATAVTNAQGVATVTIAPNGTPGSSGLTITYAGETGYLASSASTSIAVTPDETSTAYASGIVAANGTPQALSAKLIDPADNVPLAGKTITFSGGGVSTTAVTNAQGIATATLTIPPDIPEPATLLVSFAGDTYEQPSQMNTPIVVYKTTTITYTGPASGDWNDPITLTATLVQRTTGAPLAGRVLSFTLGSQTAAGTTNASGMATVTLTPSGTPGTTALSIAYAGEVGYLGTTTSATVTVNRDETTILYTGAALLANGTAQQVTAVLRDPDGLAVIPNEPLTFAIGTATANATTDPNGIATASITVPTSLVGTAQLQISFAGDTDHLPSQTSVPITLYQPSSFVIWGGNATPPKVGDRVNFWGSQWTGQVTGGDYQGNNSFKGYAKPVASAVQICESARRTNSNPPLDQSCWTASPGNSGNPPSSVASVIQVIVATSIDKSGSTIFGNIAGSLAVSVEPGYDGNPGHPGYGTILGVIQDGAQLFPNLTYTGPSHLKAGAATTVSALLVDTTNRTPVQGKTLSFALGSATATGVTDANGVATAGLTLPANQATGATQLKVSFTGDASEPAIQISVSVTVDAAIQAALSAPPMSERMISHQVQPVAHVAYLKLPRMTSSHGMTLTEASEGFSLFDLQDDEAAEANGPEALGTSGSSGTSARTPFAGPLAITPGSRRYSFYTPEMNLLAESELTTNAMPAVLNEYVWFNGHPVAQVDGGATVSYTFTDHLGTPLLQTSSAAAVTWRAEQEPFGSVYTLRAQDLHQPLRFPGQEAEQLYLGGNGLTDREYNIFRWYRPAWGRYTQTDPVGLQAGSDLYTYALDAASSHTDPLGLRSCASEIPDQLAFLTREYYQWLDNPTLALGQQDGARYWGPIGNLIWICSGGRKGSSCTAWGAGLLNHLSNFDNACCRVAEHQRWGWLAGPVADFALDRGSKHRPYGIWPWSHTSLVVECRCDTDSDDWTPRDWFDPFWRPIGGTTLFTPLHWPRIPWSPWAWGPPPLQH